MNKNEMPTVQEHLKGRSRDARRLIALYIFLRTEKHTFVLHIKRVTSDVLQMQIRYKLN